MSDLQTIEPHLRIAHSIAEQIMVSDFTEQQRRILDLILRLSWGCGKKVAYIPRQSDFEIVRVGKNKIKAHLSWLQEAGVILRDGPIYAFNQDFTQWRISRSLKYTHKRVAELVRLNLGNPDDEEVAEKATRIAELAAKHHNMEIAEKGIEEFPKREPIGSQKGYSSTPDSASPKEILNKYKFISDKYIDIITGDTLEVTETFPREAGEIWSEVLRELRPQVSALNYRTWLDKTAGLGYFRDDFIVGVNNAQVLEYLDQNLRPLLSKTLISVAEKPFSISFLNGETDIC